jgi:hypothetical protein
MPAEECEIMQTHVQTPNPGHTTFPNPNDLSYISSRANMKGMDHLKTVSAAISSQHLSNIRVQSIIATKIRKLIIQLSLLCAAGAC